MQAELDDFVNFCRVERRLAPLTCSAYERDVGACRAFLEAEGIDQWGEVRPPDLRRFLAAEAERRPAASSQSHTIAALKGFFGAVDEGPNVVISGRARRVDRDGRTSVRLRCPASLRQPSRCRGRLRRQLATRRSLRRRAPRTRYSLRPGQAQRIPVCLSRRDRRTLRRRRRANGVITSVETGQHGKKTTVEAVKLRARG